ncbi:MAG: YfhO family protein, partial [Anaerolineales bacterium]
LLSQRSGGLDPEFALTYSFWPWRLVGLIAPDIFGTPAAGTYWGYGNYWEDAIYIGVFPLLMAIGAASRQFRKGQGNRPLSRFLFISALVVLILAFGKNTPVFRFLYEHIPSFDLFQAPTRWNLLFVFSAALLAGIGVSHWKTPEGRGLYWTRLGTAGAGIIGAASYGGAWLLNAVEVTFVPAFARAGVLLFAAGLLTLFLNKSKRWGVLFSIGLFVLVDLVTAGYGLNPVVDAGVFQGKSRLADVVDGRERVYMPPEMEAQLKFEQTHRFDTFYPGIDWRTVRDVGLPNTPMLDGIASANNFDPFTPARYEQWMLWLDSLPPDVQASVMRWTDVGWRARWDEDGALGISYEDLGAASRALLVPQAATGIGPDQALAALSNPMFDASSQILIESTQAPLSTGSGGQAVIRPQANPNKVYVETSADGGGWLLLSDSWYPGWKVYVDGEQTELYRANYLFMGTWVPEGQHQVVFSYRPGFVVPAALTSAIGWLAVVILAVRQRRR